MRNFLPLLFFISAASSLPAQTYRIQTDTLLQGTGFRGASVVNDKVAWVSGSKGTVGKTVSGGLEWSFTTVGEDDKAELRDIEAWDENTAIVLSVRNPARMLKTTDGGKSWKTTYEDAGQDIFLDGMAWWDKNKGIAYGDPVNGRFIVLRTDNGGDTWKPVPPEQCPVAAVGEAGFAASGSGIITLKGGRTFFATGGTESNVFFSSDYGQTWEKFPTPVMRGMGSRGINSLAFFDEKNGIAMGGDFTAADHNEEIYSWTEDGGKTWISSKEAKQLPKGYRSCVEYLSKTLVIATGKNGTDFSTDGGKNWENIDHTEFNVVAKAKKGKWVLLAGPGKIARLVY